MRVYRRLIELRRYRNVFEAKQFLEGDKLADIIPLDLMADPLEQISKDNRTHAPIPLDEKK